jgi:hypothetical protein
MSTGPYLASAAAISAWIGGHSKAVDVARDAGKLVAGVLEIGDHHAARAGLRVGTRNRRTNAARRSRNHTDPVLDVHALASCSAIVIRVISILYRRVIHLD